MSRTVDPIVSVIRISAYRVLFFLAGALLVAVLAWVVALHKGFDLPTDQVWDIAQSVYAGDNPTARVLGWLCGALGLLGMSNAYLLLALWWRRRGDVYRRGARLVDTRDGRY